MNMQDYRHAADRVHIAEHCEEEVLSMTAQTEQKTRRPLLRTATGIAATAACLGITGALGLALFRMGTDSNELLTATSEETESVIEITEPADTDTGTEPVQDEGITETYEDFAAAYYEKIAGHPVNYDWSSLCGTNFNEVWETEDGTITLKAAVTDGYQAQFFYTFKPNYDWDHTAAEERGKKLPQILFNMTFRSSGDSGPFVSLDDTVREDGTIRFYRYLRASMTAEPIPEDGICIASVGDQTREIKLNMPEQMPQWREFSDTLHLVNDGTAFSSGLMETDYHYVLVTPLCAILVDVAPPNRAASLKDCGGSFAGKGMNVFAGSASADALTLRGERISVPLNLIENYDVFSGEASYQFRAELSSEDQPHAPLFDLCWLQFKEPQDLSEIAEMTFASPENGTAVSVDLTSEKLPFTPELDPDRAEINIISEPTETAAPAPTATTANAVQIPAETKITAQKPAGLGEEQGSLAYEIVYRLSMLDWSSDTCDGLPEYQWTGPDGNLYYFNLSSNWAWRNSPGTTTGTRIMKEAQLTKEILALLNEYIEKYGLDECEY